MFAASMARPRRAVPADGEPDRQPAAVPARVRRARAVEGPVGRQERARARGRRLDNDELVLANSRLAIISRRRRRDRGAVRGRRSSRSSGAPWVLRTGSRRVPPRHRRARSASRGPSRSGAGRDASTSARRSTRASIVVAGTAMGLLRGVVGFFTFFAAFALKRSHEPAWVFGVVLIAQRGRQRASARSLAPLLRKKVREEWMLAGALLVPALPLVLAARDYGRVVARRRGRDGRGRRPRAGGSRSTACSSATAPKRHGAARSPRFETRSSSCGSRAECCAVLFPGGGRGGIFVVAVVLLFAGLSYVGGVPRGRAAAKYRSRAAAAGLERADAIRDPRDRGRRARRPAASPTSAASAARRTPPGASRELGRRRSSTAPASRSRPATWSASRAPIRSS